MTSDSASLDRLHDILAPSPVPWWPPAPGGYLVLGIILVLLLVLAAGALRRHLRRAYRREALAATRTADLSASEVATLLKRVALTAYPRKDVAGLTGPTWLDWLTETGGLEVPPAVADTLTTAVYTGSGAPDPAALTAFARQWIRRHRPPRPET